MIKLIPLLLLYLVFSFNVAALAGEDPLTPKAYLIRYWKKHISNELPQPRFLLDKASPLSAFQSATFTALVLHQNALSSTQLSSFCSSANLFCFPDSSPNLKSNDSDYSFFSSYIDKNFTTYATGAVGGVASFSNYSDSQNNPVDTFTRYSRDSEDHKDQFANYAPETNVAEQSFKTYGAGAIGGSGEFKSYADGINVADLKFTSYSDKVVGREQKFTSYTDNSNAGDQSFVRYGKSGKGAANEFSSYGNETNVVHSSFTGYGQKGSWVTDNFTSYSFDGNNQQNNFTNYGADGVGAVDTFSSYRDQSNVGDDTFQSYARDSNVAEVDFSNYGQSFNEGTDTFIGYAKGTAQNQEIGFKIYGVNNTFKDYAKVGVGFAQYLNDSSRNNFMAKEGSGKSVNKWVEQGKFFREKMLKKGSVLPMPDIRDKMPKRSFLPRLISSKLPFSTSKIAELKKIFHASDNSSVAGMVAKTLAECEREPSRGETKRCVSSIEDMIDFATSVLGKNVAVRTTESTQGSKQNVMIGSVKRINGGKVTKSVSCHQSLFPYLVYYCHSVPKVRLYEADLLEVKTKSKINHGVAICHVDTSEWSATHGAFVALGSGPGKIEVCHWIFENDMNWAVADTHFNLSE